MGDRASARVSIHIRAAQRRISLANCIRKESGGLGRNKSGGIGRVPVEVYVRTHICVIQRYDLRNDKDVKFDVRART